MSFKTAFNCLSMNLRLTYSILYQYSILFNASQYSDSVSSIPENRFSLNNVFPYKGRIVDSEKTRILAYLTHPGVRRTLVQNELKWCYSNYKLNGFCFSQSLSLHIFTQNIFNTLAFFFLLYSVKKGLLKFFQNFRTCRNSELQYFTLQLCSFIKETAIKVLSCEFCKSLKNLFNRTENLWATASVSYTQAQKQLNNKYLLSSCLNFTSS